MRTSGLCVVCYFVLLTSLSTTFSQPVELTQGVYSEYHPEWTPDGEYVVYTVNDGSVISLEKINVSSREVTPIEITGQGDNADFDFGISSDGIQIIFDARNPSGMGMVLYLAFLTGGPVTSPGGSTFEGVHPSWSPADNRIVFHRGGWGNRGLHVMDLDSGEINQINVPNIEVMHPTFSYDGSTIIFAGEANGNRDIYTIPSDGSGNATRITTHTANDDRGTISPDGNFLVFHSERSGNLDIWLLSLLDNTFTQLTTYSGLDYHPAWSPDGNTIAFVSDRSNGNWNIWTINMQDYTSAIREENNNNLLPDNTILAYPNPFNSSGRIEIRTHKHKQVNISLYNINGQRVWTDNGMSSGTGVYRSEINTSFLANGMYILAAETSGTISHKKILCLK